MKMPNLLVYTTGPQDQALSILRYGAAARALGWQVILGKEGVDTIYVERVAQADVVLIQRDFPRFFKAYRKVLHAAHAAGKPILYDIDDLAFALPESHPTRRVYEDCLGGMLHAVLYADLVVTSTELLRTFLLPFNPHIVVFPTVLPDDLWQIRLPQSINQTVPLRIGYMGSRTHLPDLEYVVPVLQDILTELEERVQLHFWGCSPPADLSEHPQVIMHADIDNYAQFAANLGIASVDLWLAPLVENDFNRCKSAIKFWEYAATGVPGIYSRLEPYTAVVRHGENGLLAGNLEEWQTAIRQLANNPQLRQDLAHNATDDLRRHGLLSQHLSTWERIYRTAQPTNRKFTPQQAMLARFSEQIQTRTEERHHEALHLLSEIAARDAEIAENNKKIEVLMARSNQLDDILQSRSWRLLQRFQKLRRGDFSPLPPFVPFRLQTNAAPTSDENLPLPPKISLQFSAPLRYHHPSGVQPETLAGRTLLTTPQGGKVVIDSRMLSIWQAAQDRTQPEILAILADDATPMDFYRAALACLSEAGLLQREGVVAILPDAQKSPQDVGLVSVVIVGYNSHEWLKECIPSLRAQTYAQIEIIFVENGTADGSQRWLAENAPEVTYLAMPPGASLATAMNAGVARSKGDFILQLNPDVRLEPDAIARMVSVAQSEPNVAAVGCKLKFWWASAFLNGLGNRVGAFSWGSDNALGHLDLGQFDHWRELPSACFAAALITRAAWQAIGAIDEGFPMYYEDSEWCYRARLLGWRVLAAPKAVAYHAFGGRVPTGRDESLSPRKLRNVVYGRMRFAYKIPGTMFKRFIRNYRAEDWTNFIRALTTHNWAIARAYWQAWKDVYHDRGTLIALRRDLQGRRVVSDEDLFGLQTDMPITYAWHGLPELTWDLVVNHYLPLIRSERTRPMPEFDATQRRPHLLIISNDIVATKMAGPGMRYLEMGLALKDEIDVTLAVPGKSDLQIEGINIAHYDESNPSVLQVLVENCDVALISGYMVEKFPFLHTTRTRLVVDLYDPFILENLHYYQNEPMGNQQVMNTHAVKITNHLLQIGDFFLCGNERQRDFWLGMLAANGRINPLTFFDDTRLQKLIDVVGIGFPKRLPQHEQAVVRGKYPQVTEKTRIVL